jgi:lysophospholipase L1-like esterase
VLYIALASSNPVIVPSEGEASFSSFLFIGDSHFEFWLCFKADDADENFDSCQWRAGNTLDNNELKGEFTSDSMYAQSLFYKSFPKALNIGRAGWKIEDWIFALHDKDELLMRLSKLHFHQFIFIQLGANNMRDPSVEHTEQSYIELIKILHRTFPTSKIVLLSILPRPFPAIDGRIRKLNSVLQAKYGNKQLPYLLYYDITTSFYRNEKIIEEAFRADGLHLSRTGYNILAKDLAIIMMSLILGGN